MLVKWHSFTNMTVIINGKSVYNQQNAVQGIYL